MCSGRVVFDIALSNIVTVSETELTEIKCEHGYNGIIHAIGATQPELIFIAKSRVEIHLHRGAFLHLKEYRRLNFEISAEIENIAEIGILCSFNGVIDFVIGVQ